MPTLIADTVGQYQLPMQTGLTTILAAGDILASLRHASSAVGVRLRGLDVEATVLTAFGAAQEVGFAAFIGRSYTVSPTGQTAIVMGASGKKRAGYPSSLLGSAGDIRVANTAGITAGTVTLDTQASARSSFWAGAIGAQISKSYDFTTIEPGGICLLANEGLVIQNSILMGATGVVRWTFTPKWGEELFS